MSEPVSGQAIVSGVLLFLTVSLFGSLAGLGILRLCGEPGDPDLRILAAPAAATVTWVLAGCLASGARIPVKNSAPWISAVTVALAMIGAWWLWRHRGRISARRRAVAVTLGAVVVASVVPWWPFFTRGLTAHLGSHNLDTAYYTAAAAYFWRLGVRPPSAPRYVEGFYRLVYDGWVHWMGEPRMGTSVLLAQLSMLVEPGEPVLVRNLLVCWLLLVTATTLGFWAVSAYRRLAPDAAGAGWPVACVLLTTGIGWGVVPALVGNWDNALLVPAGPLLAGLLLQSRPTWRLGVMLGVVAAYGLYVYPELAPVLFAVLLPMAVRDPAGGWRVRDATRALAVGAVAAGVLFLPGLRALWKLVQLHVNLAAQGVPGSTNRPGGLFAFGLLERPWDPGAWWALGPDQPHVGGSVWATAAGTVLTALLALGAVHRARGRFRADAAGVFIVVLLAGYFVWIARYAYPAYKVLSISAWLVGWCVTEGARVGFRTIPFNVVATRRLGWLVPSMLAASLIGAGALSAETRLRYYFSPGLHRLQPSTRSLLELRQAAREQRERVVLVSMVDPFLVQPWIFYTLRDSRLTLYAPPPAHAPGGRPLPRDATIAAVLIPRDRDWVYLGHRPLLATRDFSLLRVNPLAFVEGIEAPNGIGGYGMWLGARSAALVIRALETTRAVLMLDMSPDPGLPEAVRGGVRVTVDGQAVGQAVSTPTRATVDVTLPAGSHRVELGVRPATGPAMVRVHGIRLIPAPRP